MKILLGCGDVVREGWVHVDLSPAPHVQVVWDLERRPWPFLDGSANEIEAMSVLEHLHDTVGFMDECWRVLEPGGRLRLEVPDWRSPMAWADPTHVRAFTVETWQYFDPDYDLHRFGRLYTDRTWKLLYVRLGCGSIATEMVKREGDHRGSPLQGAG